MKEYLVCEAAYSYGVYLHKARRFTEDEKKNCAEWFRDKGFVGIGDPAKLEYITWTDVREILKERKDDGSFSGCSNCVYIISDDERNALVELNKKKRTEKEKKETEESITEYRQIIEQCEKQKKLYTKEEATKNVEIIIIFIMRVEKAMFLIFTPSKSTNLLKIS